MAVDGSMHQLLSLLHGKRGHFIWEEPQNPSHGSYVAPFTGNSSNRQLPRRQPKASRLSPMSLLYVQSGHCGCHTPLWPLPRHLHSLHQTQRWWRCGSLLVYIQDHCGQMWLTAVDSDTGSFPVWIKLSWCIMLFSWQTPGIMGR